MPISTSGQPPVEEPEENTDYQKGISQDNLEDLRSEFVSIGGIVNTRPDMSEVRDGTQVYIPKTDADGKEMYDRYQAINGKWFLLPDTAEHLLHGEGSSEQYETGTVVTILVQHNIYPIEEGWTNHYLHNMDNGSGVFTIKVAGDYFIAWTLAIHSSAPNEIYGCGLLIDNVNVETAWSHLTLGGTGAVGTMGASTMWRLKAGQRVSIGIKNTTSTADPIIDHASFSVFRLR